MLTKDFSQRQFGCIIKLPFRIALPDPDLKFFSEARAYNFLRGPASPMVHKRIGLYVHID